MKEIPWEGKHLRMVTEGRWEYVERVGVDLAAILVAVTRERRLLLVEQFRIPLGSPVIELPAGLVGDSHELRGEAVETAARRELLEETGYRAETMEILAQGPVTSGLTNEQICFLWAGGLEKIEAGGGDEHEDILVHEVPIQEVEPWLKAQETRAIADPKIFTGMYFAMKKLALQRG